MSDLILLTLAPEAYRRVRPLRCWCCRQVLRDGDRVDAREVAHTACLRRSSLSENQLCVLCSGFLGNENGVVHSDCLHDAMERDYPEIQRRVG